MKLSLPELSLIVLIGPSGAGKTSFARHHFLPTEVLSSDACRALVSDDATDQSATEDAFALLHFIARKRLARGLLTVVDATNVQKRARQPLVALARSEHVVPVAIVFDLPEDVCQQHNQERSDHSVPTGVVRRQHQEMRRSLKELDREGFKEVLRITSLDQLAATTIEREKMPADFSTEHGPFDIIGDVHGCCDELEELLQKMGYRPEDYQGEAPSQYRLLWRPPSGRRALFVGDLVDRGPRVLDSFDLMRNMVDAGYAFCVPGNHEQKLLRYLRGKNVKLNHGLDQTVEELEALPPEERAPYQASMAEFIESLIDHLVLDDYRLVVAHAGLKEEMHLRYSGAVRSFALYGDTTGERDEYGLPIRLNWAAHYRGKATVVYGHTPVPQAQWLNRTINIDTACVFGGKLTALQYPEKKIFSVPAKRVYTESRRPLDENASDGLLSAQHAADHVLDLEDFSGPLRLKTSLLKKITIPHNLSAAALETASRFAVHPKWLIYLPPTMSPAKASARPDLLEGPEEAFAYYRKRGVETLVCEEKHMGSRAIAVICRDEDVVRKRFGLLDQGIGVIYTRQGRSFFPEDETQQGLLYRAHDALTASNFWEDFRTDWVAVDAEIMPWSLKAQKLLNQQYAAVGAAADQSLSRTSAALARARKRGVDVGGLDEKLQEQKTLLSAYRRAYRNYCRPVESLDDIAFAPFHVLATASATHFDRSHLWHMETIAKYFQTGHAPSMHRTAYRVLRPDDEKQCADTAAWWESLVASGGEGMVVKPEHFITRGKKGLVQPAIKCRGPEYLRIIYGPTYSLPENLARLKERHLGKKRSLARREFALGIEALNRFVAGEPLWRVHRCVLGILALEADPVALDL